MTSAQGPSDDAPSRVAPSIRPGGGPPTCGPLPASSGPLAVLARLELDAPAAAQAGQEVRVSVTVRSTSDTPRVITTPATSALLVVRGDQVVGRAVGTAAAAQVPLQLPARASRPAQAIPESVRLVACADSGTTELAAGQYAIVAVLGYQLDSLNTVPEGAVAPPRSSGPPTGARAFRLVSPPAPITVH